MLKKFIRINQGICQKLAERFPVFFGGEEQRFEQYERVLREAVHVGIRVLEIGCADRPTLQRNAGYKYYGLDIDSVDGRAVTMFDGFYHQSITDLLPEANAFDVIFSTTLIEHVDDNTLAFQNMLAALKPGGKSIHYFPLKNAPYSLVLRLIGHRWQKVLVDLLCRSRGDGAPAYRTFFNKCSVREMRMLLSRLGYGHVDYMVYYRASSYFSFFIPLFVAVVLFENFCRHYKLELFSSGMLLIAIKKSVVQTDVMISEIGNKTLSRIIEE